MLSYILFKKMHIVAFLTWHTIYCMISTQHDPWLLQSLGSRQKVAEFLKPCQGYCGRTHENDCQQMLTPLQRAAPKAALSFFALGLWRRVKSMMGWGFWESATGKKSEHQDAHDWSGYRTNIVGMSLNRYWPWNKCCCTHYEIQKNISGILA